MKLLYCTGALYNSGGMERVLTEKVNALVQRGYEITIITTDQKGKDPYFKLNPKVKLIDAGLNFEDDFKQPYWKKAIIYRRKRSQLKRFVEAELYSEHYDYAISLCGKEIDFWSNLKTTAMKIAELHFAQDFKRQFLIARKSFMIWNWIGKVMTKSFVKSTINLDLLVVLTKSDEKIWLKTNSNIRQIYNPTSIVSKELPNLNVKRFIAVGRLDEQKGFDILIPIWSEVNKIHPDWQLDIFGVGPKYLELNKLIDSYNLQNIIKLRGVSDNIAKEYLNSSGLIMTSRYEGFPLALIEAQSCGLPIVAFDCPCGPSEIIEDNVNGFLIPLNNIELMVDKTCSLIEDLNLRKTFSKNAKKTSLRFSLDNIIDNWDNLFKKFPK